MPKESPEGFVFKKVVGIPTYEAASLVAAREKAKRLVERAKITEAVSVVEELMDEVSQMHLAERHKKYGIRLGERTDESTDNRERKREKLKNTLSGLRQRLFDTIAQLESVVIDIEATKTE